ncbi:DNA repair protein RecO [Rosettibacter firmus]|uniref:DNA repair protein RecO n=1 Tax=Rosettibacter firmus TaxID=3111522 RepID=UPI00336BE7F2
MSEIIKTRAIVLRKLDYGDTSKIAQFYTEDFGKISAIIKGGRTPKSKIGLIVDTFNLLQIIIYRKETRDVQIISDAELLQYYSNIKEDFERLKYASAVIELLLNLTIENDHNQRLFNGTERILELLNTPDKNPKFYFAKYFLFFIKEIGYEFPVNRCSLCKKELINGMQVYYNYDNGILCSECSKDRLIHFEFTKELFKLLKCLNTKINNIQYTEDDLNKIIQLLEKFIKYHIQEFKGLKSLELS